MGPQRIALISGADSNYYPLLREWLASVKRFPQSASMDICIIDGGLSDQQVAELKPLVAHIVNPEWPSVEIAGKAAGKNYLKSCICRPFIPEIFPGYDIYMWMDSDTWVQDWPTMMLFIEGAKEKPNSIMITNGADRAYKKQVRVKWLGRWPFSVRNFYFSNAKKAFNFNIAKKLVSHYVLYAGCFAMSAKAPHWARWQHLVKLASRRGKIFTAEQLALGCLVHIEGFKAELLPAYAHWVCGARPRWDAEKEIYIESYLPHHPIGILHLSGVDSMRKNRNQKEAIFTRQDEIVYLNLRYPHYDAGELLTGAPERK